MKRHLASTISETAFANSILEWAKVYGWHRFHVRTSGINGRSLVQGDKGFPDLLLIQSPAPVDPKRLLGDRMDAQTTLPRVIVAELKVGKGKRSQPRADQQEWLDLFACIPNVEVYVWNPEDWTSILRLLGANLAG